MKKGDRILIFGEWVTVDMVPDPYDYFPGIAPGVYVKYDDGPVAFAWVYEKHIQAVQEQLI